jgi:hypothetical protein
MNVDYLLNLDSTAILSGQTKFETRVTGGAKATGKILFAANPTADDTITVGDVTLTFKAVPNASLDEVKVEADLSTTISSIITKLGTYASGTVTGATYSKTDTNAALTSTWNTYSTEGNSFVLASSSANGTVTAMSGGVDGLLSLEHEVTYFDDTTAADHQYFTLPAGAEGQRKTLLLGARTNAKNIVVAPVNGVSATLTFDAANEYYDLIYLDSKWRGVGGTATAA